MSTPTFVIVRTARTQAEAGLLVSILQQAGLHPMDLDTASNFSIGGAEIDYAVRVPNSEVADAREILGEYARNAA